MGGVCGSLDPCGYDQVADGEGQSRRQYDNRPFRSELHIFQNGDDQIAVPLQNQLAPSSFAGKRPRRALHISTTPGRGLIIIPRRRQTASYRFYCPICFCYHAEIFETSCCRNHICGDCGLKHILAKSKEATLNVVFPHADRLAIRCPHCTTIGFRFIQVQGNAIVRTYVESPGTKLALQRAQYMHGGAQTPETTSVRSCRSSADSAFDASDASDASDADASDAPKVTYSDPAAEARPQPPHSVRIALERKEYVYP